MLSAYKTVKRMAELDATRVPRRDLQTKDRSTKSLLEVSVKVSQKCRFFTSSIHTRCAYGWDSSWAVTIVDCLNALQSQ